jgi:hypothetical protein
VHQPAPVAARDRRPAAQFIYRIITLAAIPVVLSWLMPAVWFSREPLYTLSVVLTFSLVLVGVPCLAVLALIGSAILRRDWRIAQPAWIGLIAVAAMVCDQVALEGQSGLTKLGFGLIGIGVLAAAWAGWFVRLR